MLDAACLLGLDREMFQRLSPVVVMMTIRCQEPSLGGGIVMRVCKVSLKVSDFSIDFLDRSNDIHRLSNMGGAIRKVDGFLLSLPSSTILYTRRANICNSLLLHLYALGQVYLYFIPNCRVGRDLKLRHNGSSPLSTYHVHRCTRHFCSLLEPYFCPKRRVSRLRRLCHAHSLLIRSHGHLSALGVNSGYGSSISLTTSRTQETILTRLGARVSKLSRRVRTLVRGSSRFDEGCRVLASVINMKPIADYRLVVGARGFEGLSATGGYTTCTNVTPCPGRSKGVGYKRGVSPVNSGRLGALLFLYTHSTGRRGGRVELCFLGGRGIRGGRFFMTVGGVTGGLLQLVCDLVRGRRACSESCVRESPEYIIVSSAGGY